MAVVIGARAYRRGLDKRSCARDTGAVGTGQSRKQLARTLSSAYAAGLISKDTYVLRVDELLGSPVVRPARLTGDLNFREASRRRALRTAADTVARAWHTIVDRARAPIASAPEALLALDWAGTTTELSIGRHRSCDVVLSELEVSRRHAQLRFRDGRWILRDLESTNGTFVNGVRIGRCELRPGDHVSLAGTELVID
jgi:hypothetical protein